MRIKPTSAYEDMCIYYTINVIRLIHVSATYCGRLQEGSFLRICYKGRQNQFTNLKYRVLNIRFKMYVKI